MPDNHVVKTSNQMDDIRTRDADSAATWFKAPNSGPARAFQDRRWLLGEIEQLRASFKNFHRLLCERFDYGHDEADWERDQLSLIEWIAKGNTHEMYEVRPRSEWHEDYGDVLWWRFPIVEAPYVGSPLCDSWTEHELEGFYTHWSAIPIPAKPWPTSEKADEPRWFIGDDTKPCENCGEYFSQHGAGLRCNDLTEG